VNAVEWREIPGWPGYLVSNTGVVVSTKRGRHRQLSPQRLHLGHQQVWLYAGSKASRRGIAVHRLVLLAFVGEPPAGTEACHRNDVSDDNRLENLYWGTHAENMQDRIRNGNNPFVEQTHCKRGHEFTPENTRVSKSGSRVCRECERAHQRASNRVSGWERARRRAAGVAA
jgi:hypothetical protein